MNPKDPPHDRLVKAMTTELEYFLTNTRYQFKNRQLHSIYFGGGTPSKFYQINQIVITKGLLIDMH